MSTVHGHPRMIKLYHLWKYKQMHFQNYSHYIIYMCKPFQAIAGHLEALHKGTPVPGSACCLEHSRFYTQAHITTCPATQQRHSKEPAKGVREMHTYQLPSNWTPVLTVRAQPSDFLAQVVDLPLKAQAVIKVTPALTWPVFKACSIVTVMQDG